MKKIKLNSIWIWAAVSAVLFIFSSVVISHNASHSEIPEPDTAYIAKIISNMEEELNRMTDSLVSELNSDCPRNFFSNSSDKWCEILNKRNYQIYISTEGIPLFWSDHSFLKPVHLNDTSGNYSVQFINNSWVLQKQKKYNDLQTTSFIVLKNDFPIENPYFESTYNPDLGISPSYTLSNVPDPAGYTVTDSLGEFLFCLTTTSASADCNYTSLSALSYIIFFIAFVAFLIFLYRVYLKISFRYKGSFLTGLLLFFVALRILQTYYRFPGFLYDTGLFSPVFYASSKVLPSLGDLLLNSFLFFFIALLFNKRTFYIKKGSIAQVYVYYLLFFILSGITGWIFISLTFHSGINVNLFNIIESDLLSFFILLEYSVLLGALLLILDKITRIAGTPSFSQTLYLVSLFFLYAITVLFAYLVFDRSPDFIFETYITVLSGLYFFIYKNMKKRIFTNILLLMILTALFICIHFGYKNYQKDIQVRKTLIMGLGNEHDVVAEMQMEELSDKIKNDYILRDLSQKPYENQEYIFSYIKNNYIFGYWTKYELQTTLCSPYDNLKIQQTGKLYPCFQYFAEMVKNNGIHIENTNFYYVDNGNGRINYIGIFDYERTNDSLINQLFIELNSKLQMHVLGYPDILIDKKIRRSKNLDDFSYAIYRNGKLVSASGKYQYSLSSRMYNKSRSEFSEVNTGSNQNLVYRPDEDTLVVLTGRRINLYNYLTLFAYIFTIFSLVFVFYYLFSILKRTNRLAFFTIKQRIRTALITVFLLSLAMLGSVTIYYIIDKYQYKQQEVLSEKMQSILIELNHKLGNNKNLKESDKENVTGLLIKFSNVFYTDIHLYDKNGVLYATSRNDVFSKGFTGTMMNPLAFNEMAYKQKTEYVHLEKIGNLEYYSGYVPFFNQEGQLMAYLNLPYFTKQTDLTREISDFIVALINILLILFIIGIWLTWWLSDTMTKPLAMIQQKLQNVSLGKSNEPIQYNRMDEIGALVREYNRMLDELEQSAKLLAESERETAWREMAKQIAHEIKNPLTPMKISIQYLQKAYQEQKPGWESMINKVTHTLIEQIDSLSTIASEFSTFARMPFPTNEKINLVEMGRSISALYGHIDYIDFSITMNNEEDLWATGDKEHMLRMFNNLIKNSIQAIPQGRKGKILIEMTGYEQEVMIKITDNGIGIPAEIQDRLYTPNFTTKSSGMGLGLAIVKRIVETMNGNIRFVTAENQGTTFFIELPKS